MRYRTNWSTVVLFCLTAVTVLCLTPTRTHASGGRITSASSTITATPMTVKAPACGANVDAPCPCPLGADKISCNCYQSGIGCVGGPPIYGIASPVSRGGSLAGGASLSSMRSADESSEGTIRLNRSAEMPDAFAEVAMVFLRILFGL
jgi:hypothetical protein